MFVLDKNFLSTSDVDCDVFAFGQLDRTGDWYALLEEEINSALQRGRAQTWLWRRKEFEK